MTYTLPHHHLPPPFDRYASFILLEDVPGADGYLIMNVVLLILLAIIQLRMFSRPPPVPLKCLPRRPALSILFKPDDGTATGKDDTHSVGSASAKASRAAATTSTTAARSFPRSSFSSGAIDPLDPVVDTVRDVIKNFSIDSPPATPPTTAKRTTFSMDNDDDRGLEFPSGASAETSTKHTFDLPDSFAPLLSSSQTEMLLHHLTADLIHGVLAKSSIRLQGGYHEIPLDKDTSRPQFVVDVPKGGCRLSIAAAVGSDGFSSAQDLDVSIPTTSRSRPMVKEAGLTFNPPLPLRNVAPTLIHIPTLFEDNTVVPRLRRIQIIRFFVDTIIAISSFIERVLWIIEGFLQIHLGKVQVTPLYMGKVENNSPEWRLSLAFSGHCLLFGCIPIPFISVVLPTFIIPQPHALLEYLLSKQPLASARLRRENIAEQPIAIAIIDSIETWTAELEVLATPPAVGIDLTLPGGVSLGMELLYGRDPSAGKRSRQDVGDVQHMNNSNGNIFFPEAANNNNNNSKDVTASGASLSSWTTNNDSAPDMRPRLSRTPNNQHYDANKMVPWKFDFSAKGTMDTEKLSVHVLNCSFEHEDLVSAIPARSMFKTRGSVAVWKAAAKMSMDSSLNKSIALRRSASFAHRAALAGATDVPSVSTILLFPDETETFHRDYRLLQYDYAFDIAEDSNLDAITFSVGANHPMLNGGTIVTTILESIYAHGSVTARQHAVLDPMEKRRKRNILRHLPAIDFTFGIMNSYIPPESFSCTNDGQTKTFPQMDGGSIMVRFVGGIQGEENESDKLKGGNPGYRQQHQQQQHGMDDMEAPVAEGIKVVADFGFSSIVLNSETDVKEFPELDIFEGAKLRALSSGKLGGCITCHLRPQHLKSSLSTTGPNIFNPLEAYEIDCSGSSLSVRIKESSTSLGHRRIIIPTETTIKVRVVESIVDMALEGKSQCELSWDFQGLSPILQVTDVGLSPEHVTHENKRQVSLLIAPLRQGRLNFHVSPVGGINITKAATSREDKEGLYDWKFFNAIVSPDQGSAERLLDVIHDKRSMNKLLQVMELINSDIHRVLKYVLTQVWRTKEILDQEGVSDPKDIIPGHRMARLFSLLLCDDLSLVHIIYPLIKRVVAGDGLDVVTVKDLLRQHIEFYDDWTPEIDRAVRWLEAMFSPITVPPPYVENNVTPLAAQKSYSSRFAHIPSAAQLYEQIHDRPHLPLEKKFSNLVGRIAPYLSFKQIEYFLQVRASKDWQPADLKRLRYVYTVKRKVLDIAESYGGLSFLPQSFLVSVFLGEATRASLRAKQGLQGDLHVPTHPTGLKFSNKPSTLASLRQHRAPLYDPLFLSSSASSQRGGGGEQHPGSDYLTPAGRVASLSNFLSHGGGTGIGIIGGGGGTSAQRGSHVRHDILDDGSGPYELGDCLLGPADVAILLQAGLTSVMKGSSVVQLNQRMLLDLVASQPKSFAVAVLAEIGTPGGQGSPRQLTSALMALLEVDQNSFRPVHRLDMHSLLESWLPGLKVPRREYYMAGGRWARQSYYEAIFSLSKSILEDAECYMALKLHVQRVRHSTESDPIPQPKAEPQPHQQAGDKDDEGQLSQKLVDAVQSARECISQADQLGKKILDQLISDEKNAKNTKAYANAVKAYKDAFQACARVYDLDKLAFHTEWFSQFYRRNYDALMIKSVLDNVIDGVDKVRYWLHCLRRGDKYGAPARDDSTLMDKTGTDRPSMQEKQVSFHGVVKAVFDQLPLDDTIFLEPEKHSHQALLDAIIDAMIYDKRDRDKLRKDPLVRLLIPNPPGNYDFTVVTAMGVITDGKAGTELQGAIERLERSRGVKTIRADTATARSFEYNAGKIIEAIESARELQVPFGLLGYSQGCANVMMAETTLFSGTPLQQQQVSDSKGLVCRQLLFSAANASIHGPASEMKVQRLIVMVEEFFKYQQGYFSRALQSAFLDVVINALDSSQFHKIMGGAQSFLADGSRAFWREAQHLAHVPTCTLRGVLEDHTTPEALEMLSNALTKQSGSALHDSQVHVYDAVGYPVYHHNRNGRILEKCDVGRACIQRTHHWSPLNEEVAFIATPRDGKMSSFDCAKDRHILPWVDVNARFGFIKYSKSPTSSSSSLSFPSSLPNPTTEREEVHVDETEE